MQSLKKNYPYWRIPKPIKLLMNRYSAQNQLPPQKIREIYEPNRLPFGSGMGTLEKSEQGFLTVLKKYFPTVLTQQGIYDVALKNYYIYGNDYISAYFPFEKHFTVDFLIVHEFTKLHFVVEVDEPYSFRERKPLHCIDIMPNQRLYMQDFWQEELLASANMVLIRFAESQVVKEPILCCKAIAACIAKTTGDLTFYKQINCPGWLDSVPRWSTKDAMRMAYENAREDLYNWQLCLS